MRIFPGTAALCLAMLSVAKLSRTAPVRSPPTVTVTESPSYAEPGPFPVSTLKEDLPVVIGNGSESRQYLLKLQITYPIDPLSGQPSGSMHAERQQAGEAASSSSPMDGAAKLPVVHFFNGFQVEPASSNGVLPGPDWHAWGPNPNLQPPSRCIEHAQMNESSAREPQTSARAKK